jgi:hypothetical protein
MFSSTVDVIEDIVEDPSSDSKRSPYFVGSVANF